MNNLQIGLIIIGLVLIGLVLGYNWFQNKRAEKRLNKNFDTSEHAIDPLLSQEGEGYPAANPQNLGAQSGYSAEPSFGSRSERSDPVARPAPSATPQTASNHRDTPHFGAQESPVSAQAATTSVPEANAAPNHTSSPASHAEHGHFAQSRASSASTSASSSSTPSTPSASSQAHYQPPQMPAVGAKAKERLTTQSIMHEQPDNEPDPTTEAVIDVRFNQPVPGQQLQAFIDRYPYAEDKRIRYFPMTEQGELQQYAQDDKQYNGVQMALILANRQGPISEIHKSKVCMIADELASQFEADIEEPNWSKLIYQARDLDSKCARLDAQVSVTLKLDQPHPLNSVVDLVRRRSFVDYAQTLAWCNAEGIPCFVLLFDGMPLAAVEGNQVENITLSIDVPNSPADPQAFGKMAAAARDLAQYLRATIVDDQDQPLQNDSTLQMVDAQLYDLYKQLQRAGLQPGSERNARVFV
ncbi:cell division protein ZipA C-terminal FtsZ-binding domain-containing protein [Brackiella oedipodis]|uniref:cell division protein ZipA C-terminal FtsZ-binding domain-containing protein n=1 Tax=Brackiella oedipodis TaxID=124225 RepID=UPI00048ED46B|nr:cell division protein ZipA C-terminal FtsZ-binding domain-containing protein [Brackiella oedipodis]